MKVKLSLVALLHLTFALRWLLYVCYLLSVTFYMLLAIWIFLKLAITCKNLFPFAPVVRLVIFLLKLTPWKNFLTELIISARLHWVVLKILAQHLGWLMYSSGWTPSPGCLLVWCSRGSAWSLGPAGLYWLTGSVTRFIWMLSVTRSCVILAS